MLYVVVKYVVLIGQCLLFCNIMENTRGTREGNLKKVNSKKETIMQLSRGIQQGEETL